MKVAEVYETTTNKLIAALEAAQHGDWSLPWITVPGELPRNVDSGNAYRGGNVLTLLLAGYASPWWGSFDHWTKRGRVVAKGQKATWGIFWKVNDRKTEKADGSEETRRSMTPFPFKIFNYEQTVELPGFEGTVWTQPERAKAERTAEERNGDADEWFAQIGADVRAGANRAFYSPVHDMIQVPEFGDFLTADGYYATLAHEHIHWTGHASRLNRIESTIFGSADYAAEELVAEIGAAFVMAILGLSAEPRKDHAAYIANWLTALHNDHKFVYRAAKHAQAAVDLLRRQSNGETADATDDELAEVAA
jgi:antirestriction protein ArdC